MKFYGIKFGCTRLVTATPGHEVVAVTTYSDNSTNRSYKALSRMADSVKLEGFYNNEMPKNDPDATKINNIEFMNMRPHVTYHYLVPNRFLNGFTSIIRYLFPDTKYVALSDD